MRPAQYPDSCYSATRNLSLPLSSLSGSEHCDVCIIGAGFTGISTAIALAQKNYNVIVLEANRVGWGASGRNGGQVSGNYDGGISQLSKYVNNTELQTFWDIAEEGKSIIRQRIKDFQIQCDITPGLFVAALSKAHLKQLKQRQQQARAFGYHAFKWIEQKEVAAIVDNTQYLGGLLDEDGFHLHPLNLALGQASAAIKLGAQIYEHSPVINIQENKHITVMTQQAQVHCRNVVICGEGYLALNNAIPKASSKILPVSTYIVATEPLSDDLARQLLPQNTGISDCRHYLNFYRLTGDKRLLFGGGSRYGENNPDNIIAWQRPALLKTLPQLADTAIDYGWGGVMGFTDNSKPWINRLSKNIYIAQGFSGHGIALSHVAGTIVAQCLTTDNERFDLFSRIKHYPLPSGPLPGKPIVTFTSWFLRLRDALGI